MTPAALLIAWAARGIAFRADGDSLRFAPADRLSSEDLALLRSHKAQLLDLLTNAVAPADWRFCWRNFAERGRPGYVANAALWVDVFPNVPTGARWLSTDGGANWHALLADPDATLPDSADRQHSGRLAPARLDPQSSSSDKRSRP
jgi:hypothetical protein